MLYKWQLAAFSFSHALFLASGHLHEFLWIYVSESRSHKTCLEKLSLSLSLPLFQAVQFCSGVGFTMHQKTFPKFVTSGVGTSLHTYNNFFNENIYNIILFIYLYIYLYIYYAGIYRYIRWHKDMFRLPTWWGGIGRERGGGEGDIEVPFWHNFCMNCTRDRGPIGHFIGELYWGCSYVFRFVRFSTYGCLRNNSPYCDAKKMSSQIRPKKKKKVIKIFKRKL